MENFKNFKLNSIKISVLLLFIAFFANAFGQINILERLPEKNAINPGLYNTSPKRVKIDLNGQWQLSLDEGKSFNGINIPASIIYRGSSVFKKNFSIPDELKKNYAFVLVAEGTGYEAEYFINSTFIYKNTCGFLPMVFQLDANIINLSNEITVKINNTLSYTNSIPLAGQNNYSKIYNGIDKDIYILAVPKIYISDASPLCKIDQNQYANIINFITISSETVSALKSEGKEFLVKSKIYKKGSEEAISESGFQRFNIDELQSVNITNELNLKTPGLWKPSNPELYTLRTEIVIGENVIDIFEKEIGFPDIKFSINKGGFTNLQGELIQINGINYFEDSPKSGSSMSFSEIERDLQIIKDCGFNCIRVPGRPAPLYLVNACNRIGIYLMQDLPFNEVPSSLMKNDALRQNANDYLDAVIKRDRNSPSIISWGVGNDFDVTTNYTQNYIVKAKEISVKLDTRPVYYTSRNFSKDICEDLVDLKGLNVYLQDSASINKAVTNLKSNSSSKTPVFISRFGYSIINDNKNGYNDPHSNEAQVKYLTEAFGIFSKKFRINFVSAYADWNSERPLNFPLFYQPTIQTEGLFDIWRVPKQSANIFKRLLNNQSLPKLTEGAPRGYFPDKSFLLIATGLVLVIASSFVYTRFQKFKDSLNKSFIALFSRVNFFIYAKEQNMVSSFNNLTAAFVFSSSIAVYFSSVFYYFRENNYWDTFLSNIFSSDSSKLFFTNYFSNPIVSIIIMTLFIFIYINYVGLVIFLISFLVKQNVHLKNIFTVVVWSLYPFIIFLPIGIIIFKLASYFQIYLNITFIIFIISFILSLFRTISGFKYLFEVRLLKAYIFGFIFFLLTFGGTIVYLNIIKSTFGIISLLLSYKI